MNAEIIAVGSELLTPFRQDTNSLFLTSRLNLLGIHVPRKMIVGDDPRLIADTFRDSAARVPLVIASGGLGPTEDDLTRESLAEFLGRSLRLDEAVLREIEARFRRYGWNMPETNRRQALVPEGAEILPNPRGTAPGIWIEHGGTIFVLLPGPPPELEPMFDDYVHPRLEGRSEGERLYTLDIRVTGIGESSLDQLIAPSYKSFAGVETTVLAGPGEIQIHPALWSGDARTATRLLHELLEKFRAVLGDAIFSTSGESLELVVADSLIAHGATIACAESCTGGLLAERLTRIPGSSTYFRGGMVCYSNDLKTAWGDVPAEMIEARGAVSPEVAIALAAGIRRKAGATLGVGITGIAGPLGGTPEKPVGTVHIAVASEEGARDHLRNFPGDRARIRQLASQAALDFVRRYFLQQDRGEA
jgi:nicotinamide-nucleotide amidase